MNLIRLLSKVPVICLLFPCKHPNLVQRRWKRGALPMVLSECPDCGYEDMGHVHGESDDWPDYDIGYPNRKTK